MNTRTLSIVSASALLLTVLMSGASAPVMAQSAKTKSGKMADHQDSTKGMKGMKGMKDKKDMKEMNGKGDAKEGPHHLLAMAYRDNLTTFAKAIRQDANRTKAVNLDLARPALAEMKRSLEQMKQHHDAQLATMGNQSNPSMSEMKQRAETHVAAIGHHLAALESELNTRAPSSKAVAEYATEILKECAGMSAMHGKDTAHKMK